MKLPEELIRSINSYKASTAWYQRWPLIRIAVPLAIPLIVILLAAAAGMTVAQWIAKECANGTMPGYLQWLCF